MADATHEARRRLPRPSWLPTLAAAVVLPVLIGLGLWQLERADERRALIAAYEERRAGEALALNVERPTLDEARFRPAEAVGRYDERRQVLIDNQPHAGRHGYRVLTPLALAGSEAAVLVDRGWVPADDDRHRLPDLTIDADGELTVRGVIDSGPGVGLRLGPPAERDEGWPRRMQYLDFQYLDDALPYTVAPFVVRLDAEEPHGYERAWSPAHFPPERHVAYAVQWFGLAAALVVIYAVLAWRRRRGRHDG